MSCLLPYIADRRDLNRLRWVSHECRQAVISYINSGERAREVLRQLTQDHILINPSDVDNLLLMTHPWDLIDPQLWSYTRLYIERNLWIYHEQRLIAQILDYANDTIFPFLLGMVDDVCQHLVTKVLDQTHRHRVLSPDSMIEHFPPVTPLYRELWTRLVRTTDGHAVHPDVWKIRKEGQNRLSWIITQQLSMDEPNIEPINVWLSIASRAQLYLLDFLRICRQKSESSNEWKRWETLIYFRLNAPKMRINQSVLPSLIRQEHHKIISGVPAVMRSTTMNKFVNGLEEHLSHIFPL